MTTRRRTTTEPATRPDAALAPTMPVVVRPTPQCSSSVHVAELRLTHDALGVAWLACPACGAIAHYPLADNLQDAPDPQDAR